MGKLKKIPSYLNVRRRPDFNWPGLVILLNKLKYINRIYFDSFKKSKYNSTFLYILPNEIFNKIFLKIITYCNFLIHFDLIYFKFSKYVWKEFSKKFSNQIQSIFVFGRFKFKTFVAIKSFTNLKILKFQTHNSVKLDRKLMAENLFRKKLKVLNFCFCCLDAPLIHSSADHHNHFCVNFIAQNTQIKSLTLINKICFQYISNDILDIFSKLKLYEFEGVFYFEENYLNKKNVLIKLSQYFSYLKKLKLIIIMNFEYRCDSCFSMDIIDEFFKNLINLEELDLTFKGNLSRMNFFNCSAFRNCLYLRKLSIQKIGKQNCFDPKFFENCGENLKSLKYLQIKFIRYHSNLISNLSQCKHLSKIHFHCLNLAEYLISKYEFKENKNLTNIKTINIYFSDLLYHII